MTKQKLLKIVNGLLIIDFVIVGTLGVLHNYIPYTIYRRVHGGGGYVLVALVITHAVLNWSWIRNTYFGKRNVK